MDIFPVRIVPEMLVFAIHCLLNQLLNCILRHWPSEDILAYFCLSHTDMFRSKKVIELGSGYGLAGLVIAAVTDALEIVISDGNPRVVDS